MELSVDLFSLFTGSIYTFKVIGEVNVKMYTYVKIIVIIVLYQDEAVM
jgi:hypothetical protein